MDMANHFCRGRGVALPVMMLCAAGYAAAADSGFYLGLDSGVVKYPDHAIREMDGTTLTGTGLDDTDFTWDLWAGYRFNRYLSLAGGYVDLGERTGQIADHSGGTGSEGHVSFAAKGEALAVIGTLPFGKWTASGRVGVLRADANATFTGVVNDSPVDSHVRVIDIHPLFGLGLARIVDDHWSVQLGWSDYFRVGSTDKIKGITVDGPNINTLTAGVSYRF
jgi:hypothetical protein